GDHAQNIAELSRRKIEEKLPFTDTAIEEASKVWEEVKTMFAETEEALLKNDSELAKKILQRENTINDLQLKFKKNHIDRLNEGNCQLNSGFVFIEIIDNLEKIADRLTNVAESIIGKMRWNGTE
ncbi:MAG: Na/Pi cotransporter family protein, partial [Candidatus Omnitrophica bacterium]|nr:Na/Pi cotransporter family protein [Candidatus Omnitrophota bacterium]